MNIKRILKISIAFILFVIFFFIISLIIFYFLDKVDLLDNKIIKFIITFLAVIIGSKYMQFIIKKIP